MKTTGSGRSMVEYALRYVLFMLLVATVLAVTPASDSASWSKDRMALLHREAGALVLEADGSAARECGRRSVVGNEAGLSASQVEFPGEPDHDRLLCEWWYVNRCGRIVAWDVCYERSDNESIGITVGLGLATAPDTIIRSNENRFQSDSNIDDRRAAVTALAPEAKATVFLVTTADDSGPGSLSQAIVDANAAVNQAGPDRIHFAIPGPGPHVISLVAALPPIIDPILIDGYTQPGAKRGSRADVNDAVVAVEINGSRISRPSHGLELRSGGSTVRGLRIRGFDGDGIHIDGSGSNVIEGNIVGADSNGNRGNAGSGVVIVHSSDNVIGGSVSSKRNVIVGNGRTAVTISGASSIGNSVLGNSIVLNGDGGIDLGLAADGCCPADGAEPGVIPAPPVLKSASLATATDGGNSEVVVSGSFEGHPAEIYRLELFATAPRHAGRFLRAFGMREPGGHPHSEGERFVTSLDVITGEDGRAGFQLRLPRGVHSREVLTATVTDDAGNTSEFSNPLIAPAFTITWVALNGFWGDALNWSPPQVPTETDDVLIAENGAGGTFTVTVNAAAEANSLTLGGGSGTQTLSLTSPGSLTLGSDSSVGPSGVLNLTWHTSIDMTGNLTIDGTFNWSAISNNPSTLTGTGTATVNGTLNLSGVGTKFLSGNLTLRTTGAVTWDDSGFLRAGAGTVIHNVGTWDARGDAAILGIAGGGTGTFTNAGTLSKSAGTDTTGVSIPLTNGGQVDAQSGTLKIAAGGSNTGALTASDADGTLEFSGVDNAVVFALGPGSTLGGPGRIRVSGPGTLRLDTAVSTPAETLFELAGGTLGGAGTLTTSGLLHWTGGSMGGSGQTIVLDQLVLDGGNTKTLSGGWTLDNEGTATWSDAGIVHIGVGGGFIVNAGTWDARSDSFFNKQLSGDPGSFNNAGLFKKTAGTGTTGVGIPFTNGGQVRMESGTLDLTGGSSTGAFDITLASGKIDFGSGTFNLNAGSTFSGTGTVQISVATVNVNVAVTIPAAMNVRMENGVIGGGGVLTTLGAFVWELYANSISTMTGTGTTMIGGTLDLLGTGTKFLTVGRTLLNTGTVNWAGTAFIRVGTGALIDNRGLWDARVDASILGIGGGGVGAFKNSGTLQKSAGVGTTAVAIPLTNSGIVDIQIGTLNVGGSNYTQVAGITKLTGGALTSTTNINIGGGLLAGSGAVTGPVIVSGGGALSPGLSPGGLGLAGDYTHAGPAPNGAFDVELGGTDPGLSFDRADISGSGSVATLAGDLNVSLVNGFTPSSGQSFTIMTYSSHTGTYIPHVPAIGCLGWRVNYGSTALVLTAVTVPVELSGLNFLPDKVGLTWGSAPIYPGTLYDVLRGNLGNLPVDSGGDETCLANGIGNTSKSDPQAPTTSHGFWYLVRERVDDCGVGTYGYATSGAERTSTVCP